QYPVCNPSRSSFLTGLRPETTRILDNATKVRQNLPDVVTLPQLFRKHGYAAHGLGKIFHRGLNPDEQRPEMDDPASWDDVFYGKATPLGNEGDGRNLTGGKLPWCRWKAANGTDEEQADGQLAAKAVELLEASRNKPFFLAIGFYRPHDPYQSPKKYFDLHPLEKFPLPQTPAGYEPPNRFALPGGAFAASFKAFGEAEKREYLRAYHAGVTFMDAQVGRILAALDRFDLAKNTIVVFVGDHGYELGRRGWWNKNTLFENSCRAPLVVRAPAAGGGYLSAGKAAGGIVEFIDLFPTLCDLAGVPAPAGLQGTSFKKLLEDPAAKGKDAAFTIVQRGKIRGRSVRTERWRCTEWDGGAGGIELYDHDVDPDEWKNLAGDPAHSETLRSLRAMFPRSP
ncbi:MAG TPA: sulfatase, partial [Planctomycetia bacterium]|nr:sulfatase [Planctomycetia bacterium]